MTTSAVLVTCCTTIAHTPKPVYAMVIPIHPEVMAPINVALAWVLKLRVVVKSAR